MQANQKKSFLMIFCALYSLLLLFILVLTAQILIGALRRKPQSQMVQGTEYIYVFASQEESFLTETEDTTKEQAFWIVKAYEGRIGIFSSDGTLLDVLETYVKTLPEADRRLLEEGIPAHTKDALDSLIEDYSH